MIIVTDRQFIIAEKILHMQLTEEMEEQGYGKARKINKVFTIRIAYVPTGGTTGGLGSRNHDGMECNTRFYNLKEARKAFREVVRQYREQNPDALYLDKIIDSVLTGE